MSRLARTTNLIFQQVSSKLLVILCIYSIFLTVNDLKSNHYDKKKENAGKVTFSNEHKQTHAGHDKGGTKLLIKYKIGCSELNGGHNTDHMRNKST